MISKLIWLLLFGGTFLVFSATFAPDLSQADFLGVVAPNGVQLGEGNGLPIRLFSFDGTIKPGKRHFPYGKTFAKPVRVAVADVNGDGTLDIVTAPGPRYKPQVRVFNSATGRQISGDAGNFLAYQSTFRGGVFVAAGDVNGDGKADIITGAGSTSPQVRVFDGSTGDQLLSFFAYDQSFTGGVRVAAGDLNGDSFAEIITGAGAGGGPHVKVFSGTTGDLFTDITAFDSGFNGGVSVAAGDVNNDGNDDIIVGAGPSSIGPQVKIFNDSNSAELGSFFAYAQSFRGGVNVAAGDVNGDGVADIITGPARLGKAQVRIFNGETLTKLDSFFPFNANFTGGVFVGGR